MVTPDTEHAVCALNMVSRRTFFSHCCRATALLALPPLSLSWRKAEAAQFPGPLNFARFAAQLNGVFRVRLDSGKVVALQLVKAQLAAPPRLVPRRRPPADAAYEKFSLVFTGPEETPLASAIHTFEHPQLGRFDMHIGEIGVRENAHVRYEAIFNQPAELAVTPRA